MSLKMRSTMAQFLSRCNMCTYSSKVPQVKRERVNLPGLVIHAIAGVLTGYLFVQVWHKDKREKAKKSFEQKALNQKKITR